MIGRCINDFKKQTKAFQTTRGEIIKIVVLKIK